MNDSAMNHDGEPHDGPLQVAGARLQRSMEKAVAEARNTLIAAGADAAVIAVTVTGEDALTRTKVSGYGNWHAQTGLIVYIHEKRLQAARNEQIFDDKEAGC